MEDAGIPGVRRIKGEIELMFLGQYQHSLDEKGRLMVPARFRELLEGGAFITQGFDRCLMVMTEEYFKQVSELVDAMNLADPSARLLRRQIFANAFPVDVDKVGRILVPQLLRQFAGIENEAIVAGQNKYFEIWLPSAWNDQMTQIQNTEANNQRYSTLNLSSQKPG